MKSKNKDHKANPKSAGNNQWTSAGKDMRDSRERKDGPGGENGSK